MENVETPKKEPTRKPRGRAFTLIALVVLFLAFFLLLFWLFTEPHADFQCSPVQGNLSPDTNQLTISFTNLSKNASTYIWDFGDGKGTSREVNPRYTYASDGNFVVRLTAMTGNRSKTVQQTIRILPPVPVVTVLDYSPKQGILPLNVNFRVVARYATNYLWDFGDGGQDNRPEGTHIYKNPGNYQLSLVLKGSGGETKVPVGMIAVFTPSPTPPTPTPRPSTPTPTFTPKPTDSPPPSPTPKPSSTAVAQQVAPWIVQIKAKKDGTVAGTGVIIDNSNVITDYNIIRGQDEVEIVYQGGSSATGKATGRDEFLNISMIKLPSSFNNPIKIAGASGIKAGDRAIAVTYSRDLIKPSYVEVNLLGIFEHPMRNFSFFPINPNIEGVLHKGAPIVNFYGEILGILVGEVPIPIGIPLVKDPNIVLDITKPSDWLSRMKDGERIVNPPPTIRFTPYVDKDFISPWTVQYPVTWNVIRGEAGSNTAVIRSPSSAAVEIQENMYSKGMAEAIDRWKTNLEHDYSNNRQTSKHLRDPIPEISNGHEFIFVGWRAGDDIYVKARFYYTRFNTVIRIQASAWLKEYYDVSGIFDKIIDSFRVLPWSS
jgi:PKD repeat protein